MRILLLSSFLPYPLFSGGHVRLFNIIKELHIRKHEITLICEKRSYQTEEDINELKKICKKVITIDRKKQWSLENILKSIFTNYPFLMVGHTQNEIKNKISEVLKKESFDLIHIETFYVFQNLPETNLPKVLVEHNVEYMVYKKFVNNLPFFLRPLFLLDVEKIKKQEEKFWEKTNALISVSDSDKKFMKINKVFIVPNGVDTEKFKMNDMEFKTKEKTILFIGDFKWIQNKDAVEFLIKEIWPIINSKLKIQNSKLKLWIVGRKIPDSIKNLTSDTNIFFDENAPKDTSEIFQKSDILLAPIRVGGGTSFKILEAMASGVPVVTTSLGIEGIDAINNENVLISDKSSEIANLTVQLINDQTKYKKIAQNARQLIEEKYNWKIIVSKLEDAYRFVLS